MQCVRLRVEVSVWGGLGLGYWVKGVGCGVWGVGCGVWGVECVVCGVRFVVWCGVV